MAHARAVNELEPLKADVLAEAAEDPNRRVNLARNPLRAIRKELIDLAASAKPTLKPAAAQRLPLLVALLEWAFGLLESAVANLPQSKPGSVRYSAKTKDLTRQGAALVQATRSFVGQRAGRSETAEELKQEVGVGSTSTLLSPIDVLDAGEAQIVTLSEPTKRRFLEKRGIDVDAQLAELKPAIAALKASLDAGVPGGLTRTAANLEVEKALVLIDIVVSRLTVLIAQGGNASLAQQLDRKMPRGYARRAGDATDDATDADDDETDGAEDAPEKPTGT